jgi:hypothetical protein
MKVWRAPEESYGYIVTVLNSRNWSIQAKDKTARVSDTYFTGAGGSRFTAFLDEQDLLHLVKAFCSEYPEVCFSVLSSAHASLATHLEAFRANCEALEGQLETAENQLKAARGLANWLIENNNKRYGASEYDFLLGGYRWTSVRRQVPNEVRSWIAKTEKGEEI